MTEHNTPELHVGTEQSGLSGVWVACSCGLSTSKVTPRRARDAWDYQVGHALAALREAVSTAYETSPLMRLAASDETPARRCEGCEQLFVPEPFGDPEFCAECLDENAEVSL